MMFDLLFNSRRHRGSRPGAGCYDFTEVGPDSEAPPASPGPAGPPRSCQWAVPGSLQLELLVLEMRCPAAKFKLPLQKHEFITMPGGPAQRRADDS